MEHNLALQLAAEAMSACEALCAGGLDEADGAASGARNIVCTTLMAVGPAFVDMPTATSCSKANPKEFESLFFSSGKGRKAAQRAKEARERDAVCLARSQHARVRVLALSDLHVDQGGYLPECIGGCSAQTAPSVGDRLLKAHLHPPPALAGCNMDYLEEMHTQAFQNDVLIVAGDVADTLNATVHALKVLRSKFLRWAWQRSSRDPPGRALTEVSLTSGAAWD